MPANASRQQSPPRPMPPPDAVELPGVVLGVVVGGVLGQLPLLPEELPPQVGLLPVDEPVVGAGSGRLKPPPPKLPPVLCARAGPAHSIARSNPKMVTLAALMRASIAPVGPRSDRERRPRAN